MIYRSQSDFYDFSCIADRCQMNCCSGWQIVIDKKSLDRYRSWNGEFEERLRSGIDYDDYEDFDFFLFDRLCYARERMLDYTIFKGLVQRITLLISIL